MITAKKISVPFGEVVALLAGDEDGCLLHIVNIGNKDVWLGGSDVVASGDNSFLLEKNGSISLDCGPNEEIYATTSEEDGTTVQLLFTKNR